MGGMYPWRIERDWLLIEHRRMPLAGLNGRLNGIRIAHISDLHCGPFVLDGYLANCMDMVNEMNPDFVCVTGDLITGAKPLARRVAKVLGRLRPRIATVACLGNHDYGLIHPRGAGEMRGLADCLERHLTDAGIYVLRNESAVFRIGNGERIQFVGLEDLWSRHWDPMAAFRRIARDLPTITLCHNPDASERVFARGAEWILAGHTHGKVVPNGRLTDLLWPMACKHLSAGAYTLGPGRHVYVNRGLAHSRRIGPQQRQEITLMNLCPAKVRTTVPALT